MTVDRGETVAREVTTDRDAVVLGFVCVQNAGRSQMSAAFADRERHRRGLDGRVRIRTGGTRPAEQIHEAVLESMQEVGIDLSDRTPRRISTSELESCDYVATMGCSTLDLDADSAEVDVRDWALEDPHGKDLDQVREIRERIRERVSALFDEIERRGEVPSGRPEEVPSDREEGATGDRRKGAIDDRRDERPAPAGRDDPA